MSKLPYRTPYTVQSIKPGFTSTEPSRTKQAFAQECDINAIMRKYELTGVMEHIANRAPMYADVVGFEDYQSNLARVRNAERAFEALPSELRAELGYNPGNLIAYMSDPANRSKLERYGLVRPQTSTTHRVLNDAGKEVGNSSASGAAPAAEVSAQ